MSGDEQERIQNPAAHSSIFEQIPREDEEGHEYWSARELAEVLDYRSKYRNFKRVIEKAITACENSGYDDIEHFADAEKDVEIGLGKKRKLEDVHLSRYACYLVVQNSDPKSISRE